MLMVYELDGKHAYAWMFKFIPPPLVNVISSAPAGAVNLPFLGQVKSRPI
jgi:hypothetical protein